MYKLHRNCDIAHLTTFGVPARCAALLEWTDDGDLADAMRLERLPKPFLIIGGGSNLLFTKPFEGTVFHRLGQMELDAVCESYCREGVWGFENLSGIPGSIFGAAVQNAGAYGTEMKDVVHEVKVTDLENGDRFILSNRDMQFGYRNSAMKRPETAGRYLITDISFRPKASGPTMTHKAVRQIIESIGTENATPMAVREKIKALRDSKLPQPDQTGSAGSFFRNPEITACEFDALSQKFPDAPHFVQADGRIKVPAAWLIDRAGLKGATEGGAQVWPLQPLVIVNATGSATAADVLALERRICNEVALKFNINLIPEVQHI